MKLSKVMKLFGSSQKDYQIWHSREWPATFEYLASHLRSGMSINQSLSALRNRGSDEMKQLFSCVHDDLRLGLPIEAATERLVFVSHGKRLREILLIGRDIGVSQLPELLLISARFMRRDQEVRDEISVRQGWVRNGARLGLAAPWIILLLLLTRHSTRSAMFTSSGVQVILIGILASVCAGFWMQRASRIGGIG